ncbi:carbohydrate-binding module family 1 protein, partial [Tulasnella calospora MUT 4182]
WTPILTTLALAALQANALLRFPCAQLTVTRSDPLISPGKVSAHLHQVVGGNSFDFGMPNNTDYLQSQSTCSTCSIKENKSNYWSPTLYFQSPKNGTFKRVAQRPGPLTGSPNAGMVVYYIQIGTVTSFPKNFRMIAGDPFLRSYSDQVDDSRSITFRCLQDDSSGNGPDTHGMPTTKCAGGIRSQINFPTCWDGKNIDTPNHKDHVRYATGSSFGNFGTGCPSTHPVTIPLLFFETVWDTKPFDNEWVNGQSPFVWSMGDPTGYGYHADYMMGWPEDVLKRAMAQCTDQGGQVSSCPVVTSRSEQEMNDCAQPNRVDEEIDGWLPSLPGCNAVQPGPARATQASGCVSLPTTTPGPTTTTTQQTTTTTPSGAQQTHWGQCGGKDYTGPKVCQSPWTCKYSN